MVFKNKHPCLTLSPKLIWTAVWLSNLTIELYSIARGLHLSHWVGFALCVSGLFEIRFCVHIVFYIFVNHFRSRAKSSLVTGRGKFRVSSLFLNNSLSITYTLRYLSSIKLSLQSLKKQIKPKKYQLSSALHAALVHLIKTPNNIKLCIHITKK